MLSSRESSGDTKQAGLETTGAEMGREAVGSSWCGSIVTKCESYNMKVHCSPPVFPPRSGSQVFLLC